MKTCKKAWTVVVALICILAFTCTASAADVSTNSIGGVGLQRIYLVPITSDTPGNHVFQKDLMGGFDAEAPYGDITGTCVKMNGLPNLVGIRYDVSWYDPYSKVYVTDPTNGFHTSAYGLEDIQDVQIRDCQGTLKIEINSDGVTDYITIGVPYYS